MAPRKGRPYMDYQNLVRAVPRFFANDETAPLHIITDARQIASWQQLERQRLEADGSPVSWADIGVILDDPYIVVLRDLIRFPDGTLRGYVRLVNRADLSGGQCVAILPYLHSTILLLRQYRHATRSWHLESPRGFGEPDIPPEDQARAELLEEIDAEVSEFIPLGDLHANTGMEAQATKLLFARLSSLGQPAKAEAIDATATFTPSQVEALIANGEITDGF